MPSTNDNKSDRNDTREGRNVSHPARLRWLRRRHGPGPRRADLCFWLCLVLALSGCAYQLGPTNGTRAATRSIQIQPFENKTIEPRLVEAVTMALRKHLQQDGTYKLDTHQTGDILVTGSILSFERHSLTFVSRDVLTPRDYRLTITAQVIARERATGRTLLDRKLTGYSDIRIGPDLTSSERQALPLVAADLARSATALLVDGSW
jgi:Lipopolysaccharide-assembly